MDNKYKAVIGFEIHVQLATKSKMFSPSANNPDETKPNTNIDEIITGQPGTLPVANKEAIRLAAMVGLALNCTIDEWSKFDRKHYFYPDLPKGYQISQYDKPISKNGWLNISLDGSHPDGSHQITRRKRIGITRAHLEEDAGKNIHPEGLSYSLVDYNRAGAALLEIVTEPEIESGEEARVLLTELRNIIRYLGASGCDMEKGTMRVEPNISVRKPGETTLPKYKVEVKNINSIKFTQAAIDYEIHRQIEILEAGGMPKQVTMGWDDKNNCTVEQRSKEEAQDYRYFPDPDLPVLQFTKEYLDDLRAKMPELPAQKRERFISEYNLPSADVENLINWKELSFYFEDVVSEIDEWIKQEEGLDRNQLIKQAVNWLLGEFSAALNAENKNPGGSPVDAENFAELMKMIRQGKVSGSAAKQVFKVMYEKGGDPSNILDDLGLQQVSDESAIVSVINKVIAANPKAVADYKAGQQKSFGFLVGQAMKELKGKGNPQVINKLLKEKLDN
ncbi:MAG: Asp-tRNA(Asn)/Glu-tRNA(Gln) amidotransferase GatCAB subunit B [Candidatus Doudnabacteria bacterium CG10_big_fil_rev_8_21_14_0_10_42_18]|uniref:Aspartyl/glutamyl-tRNA(Asn/Gln) amidotransferase subunit B n=1 Tax=Candidatus Doudnabacteria bacterium CG10_big_fil_rev_8_21_14_0_10_42_18 TaxID=1974552 RepID=A0A2H0VEC9_9BACT|nr:MAG: Asp-tRNA(Asn)/Glu-tRNA(Gln) amidotransferase GatCAB subunit B [Candidatus Doudnabacteria bacterium CG10_big_fil_rev_8_21_14_0_10_42_18]